MAWGGGGGEVEGCCRGSLSVRSGEGKTLTQAVQPATSPGAVGPVRQGQHRGHLTAIVAHKEVVVVCVCVRRGCWKFWKDEEKSIRVPQMWIWLATALSYPGGVLFGLAPPSDPPKLSWGGGHGPWLRTVRYVISAVTFVCLCCTKQRELTIYPAF